LHKKGDILSYRLDIPTFTNINNKELQKQLNQQIAKEILTFKHNIFKEAKNASILADQNGWTFRPYEAVVTYKTTYNKHGILSFVLSYYQFTGGAHGLETWKSYNISLCKGSCITSKDLSKYNKNYQQIIKQEIIRQIRKKQDIYFPDAEQKVLDTKDFLFYISENVLVVYFPLYEIAPYSSGIQTFTIPFSLLRTQTN